MMVRPVAITAILLAVLGIAALVLVAVMSFLANETSIGLVERPATATPALSGAFTLIETDKPTPTLIETDKPTPTLIETDKPTATPTAAVQTLPTTIPYDPNTAMYLVFAGYDLSPGFGPLNERTLEALGWIRANDDKSQVRVIIESLRFLYSNDIIVSAIITLSQLTGETAVGDNWKWWSEWIGRNHDAYPPPEEYAEWKINYMRQFDGRFGAFLSPALKGQSDVDLKEIEWGGVIPDGIPPLENPGHAPADDPGADYLEDDERVIGVSINGEHRAYPLRIVNAHELVNDELGGEPLSLTW